MNKTIALTLAAIMAASTASADMAKPLIRTSVQDLAGNHVAGFITRGGTIQRYVPEAATAYSDFADDVHIVPAYVDTKDVAEVQAYLASLDIKTAPLFRGGRTSCAIGFDDRDPDGGNTCYADDGLDGTVGESVRTSRSALRW
jgi:hypothetical protein